jgi:hypothetical protein
MRPHARFVTLVAALALGIPAFGARQAEAQETRTQIIRARPIEATDTTGLVNAPESFAQVDSAALPLGSCAPRLRDAAANLDLLLIAANTTSSTEVRADTLFTFKSAIGDYAPQARSAYGLAADELVRVDCATNRPIGRARRSPPARE